MKIIAFTGKKGTGKSTACKYLESKYGAVRVNFKDALIAELKQYYSLVLDELSIVYGMSVDELFDVKPPAVRKLMQSHGQMRRQENPEYWVQQWADKINELYAQGIDLFTTDDCRHLNESYKVNSMGGIIIAVIRTDMEHTDSHVSEIEMEMIIPYETIICHGGDEEDLYERLDKIAVHIIN